MARHPQNSPQIERLIRLSAASRSRLSHDAAALRHRLDGPARAWHSLRSHPVRWLGGSLATAFAATLLFRRKTASPSQHRGWRGLLGGLVLTALRPAVTTWVSVQLKQFIASQLHPQPQPLSRPLPAHPGHPTPRPQP
jgi:hypothetical protein